MGLDKRHKNEQQFLRDEMSEEECLGLEAIVSELGEAARAEYLCAKFPDRFEYNHQTILNLRSWLGDVEVFRGNPLINAPIGLFSIQKLEHLKIDFFNRMRDKYLPEFQVGIEEVKHKLLEAQKEAKHSFQKDFIR